MANINVTPQEVADLGRFCQTSTDDITQLISKVEAQLGRTTWESTAATAFRTDWGTHKANLGKMQTQLHDLGEAAKTMAKNYDEADAAYGKG
jgi:WXG100 family type VII secretion target